MRFDRYIDLRVKCAMAYCDMTGLTQCVVTMVNDLRDALENEGRYSQLVRRNINLAEKTAVAVSNKINDEVKATNRTVLPAYVTLYEELLAKLEQNVYLQGSERFASMIVTACDIITEKWRYCKKYGLIFREEGAFAMMEQVGNFIRMTGCELHDLTPIFRPVLDGLLTKEEKVIARQNCEDSMLAEIKRRKHLQASAPRPEKRLMRGMPLSGRTSSDFNHSADFVYGEDVKMRERPRFDFDSRIKVTPRTKTNADECKGIL